MRTYQGHLSSMEHGRWLLDGQCPLAIGDAVDVWSADLDAWLPASIQYLPDWDCCGYVYNDDTVAPMTPDDLLRYCALDVDDCII